MVAETEKQNVEKKTPSLFEAFKNAPDPRKPRGVRHQLTAMLTLAATAMICGAKSVLAVSQWGQHRPHLAKAFGFERGKMPCNGAFHYLFKELDAKAFEACITDWLLNVMPMEKGKQALNIDGKVLKGSGLKSKELPGIRLLSLYAQSAGSAVTQLQVRGNTNEHKTALELLDLIPLEGRIVTGDAAFTQRDISQKIVENGGDYFLQVKGNQPTLQATIAAAFENTFSPSS